MDDWKEIKTQKDIDALMHTFMGFHDSCIVSANYRSGLYVDGHSMVFNAKGSGYELSLLFHGQWEPRCVELLFGGVRRMHLVGLQDNYLNDIFDAHLAFYDNILPGKVSADSRVIVWADNYNFKIDNMIAGLEEPADSYVIATTLRWRIADEDTCAKSGSRGGRSRRADPVVK